MNVGESSLFTDVCRYVIIRKFQDFILNVFLVFISWLEGKGKVVPVLN
jgi:hypothetical protein